MILISVCVVSLIGAILLVRKGLQDSVDEIVIIEEIDEHSPEHLDFDRIQDDLEIRNLNN